MRGPQVAKAALMVTGTGGQSGHGPRGRTGDLAFVVTAQLLDGPAAVAGPENARMRGDPHNSCTREAGEAVVLELLADHPRQEVAVRQLAGRQRRLSALPGDRALQCDLDDGQDIRELVLQDSVPLLARTHRPAVA